MSSVNRVTSVVIVVVLLLIAAAVAGVGWSRRSSGLAIPATTPVFTERFSGSNPRLEATGWIQVAGRWTGTLNNAFLIPDERTSIDLEKLQFSGTERVIGLLVRALDAETTTIAATVMRDRPGCGLAFRFEDPLNYWMVVSSPEYATWSIFAVEGGVIRFVANTGVSSTAGSTRITVNQHRDELRVYVEAMDLVAVTGSTIIEAPVIVPTSAGLVGLAGCSPGQWSNYVESR